MSIRELINEEVASRTRWPLAAPRAFSPFKNNTQGVQQRRRGNSEDDDRDVR